MKRKDFIRGSGLAGLGLAFTSSKLSAGTKSKLETSEDCALIPSEVAGPFPLDLEESDTFFRQDIRENEQGVTLNLKLKIIGLDNCQPMPNVRVNIWHCDKDGVYSGYDTGSNPGDPEGTHLRGYQFTDANGVAEFITVFPGLYSGRICHIHFQVYVSSSYAAISQFTFPIEPKNVLYNNHPAIYTKGSDPLGFDQDLSFSDSHELQVASLEVNPETGEYHSYLEVTVKGSGTTGIGHIEWEAAKVFELGQNYPNPYEDKTIIPLHLKQNAYVELELWDLAGRKVRTLLEERKTVGHYEIEVNPSQLDLPIGNYVYQLVATNDNGIFRMPKMMTIQG